MVKPSTSSTNLPYDSNQNPTFSVVLSAPINGKITNLIPFRHPSSKTDYIFFITDSKKYAVISYAPAVGTGAGTAMASTSSNNTNATTNSIAHNIITHSSGDLADYGLSIRGNEPEHGILVTMEPNGKCIALHLNEGYVTVLPIHQSYRYKSYASNSTATGVGVSSRRNQQFLQGNQLIGPPFHCRIDERDIFSMEFLHYNSRTDYNRFMSQLTLLHQDSRGLQHVIAHSLDLQEQQLIRHHSSPTTNKPSTKNANDPNANGSSNIASASAAASSSSTMNTAMKVGSMQPLPIHLRLKKSRVEAGSGIIIPIQPSRASTATTAMNSAAASSSPSIVGGVLILGHRSITYHNTAENNNTKSIPMPPCFIESYSQVVTPSSPSTSHGAEEENQKLSAPKPEQELILRFLLGDDLGRIHILAIIRNDQGFVTDLHLDTLGEANVSSCLVYLENGLFFLGSQYTDAQFIEILDEPVDISSSSHLSGDDDDDDGENGEMISSDPLLHGKNVTFFNVLDEYINLGPIVDFDLVPITHNNIIGGGSNQTTPSKRQSMAITASGAGKDGTLRLVSNGIGMIEYATAELPCIKEMWSIRKSFYDSDDAYLIQSYVGETRILGVLIDESDIVDLEEDSEEQKGGTSIEEVEIDGIDASTSTLFAGNVITSNSEDSSIIIQITEQEVRLIDLDCATDVCTWSPSSLAHVDHSIKITIAAANEAGQIALALGGGIILYLQVICKTKMTIEFVGQVKLDREISCLNLNPIDEIESMNYDDDIDMMDVDGEVKTDLKPNIMTSNILAVGLWNDTCIRLLSLSETDVLNEIDRLSISQESGGTKESDFSQHLIARSVCFVTLEPTNTTSTATSSRKVKSNRVNMLLVGLGDGGLVSFVVGVNEDSCYTFSARKETVLGTRAISLIPFSNRSSDKGTCVLATGDKPTIIYLGGSGSNKIPKLCYSNVNLKIDSDDFDTDDDACRKRFQQLSVNSATPFHSAALLSASNNLGTSYSICISDETTMRLGMIDNIQKLHVTSYRLGMAPRRVTHHESGRVICVGCIDDGSRPGTVESHHQGNCIRFLDDTTFEEVDRIDLDPFEMILSMASVKLKVNKDSSIEGVKNIAQNLKGSNERSEFRSFLVVGTSFSYPDEDEPSRGRILLIHSDIRGDFGLASRKTVILSEVQVSGGVFSICSFYNGTMLATINTKTRLCKLFDTGMGNNRDFELKIDNAGHRGHILSLLVKSQAEGSHEKASSKSNKREEQIAIVGDIARSISVVKHYPEYGTLEEVARDFNQNWVTAIEMLTNDIYLGAENFSNLYILRRNPDDPSEEVRSRLDTIGLFNIGEMINKFVSGSLVIPNNPSKTHSPSMSNMANPSFRAGSETLFGTIDGTIGSVIGLDAYHFRFLSSLERAMVHVIEPVGNLKHDEFRAYRGQRHQQASKGFIDGDLIETFVDLDQKIMELVVKEMNRQGKWKHDDSTFSQPGNIDGELESVEEKSKNLTLSDVIAIVEEVSMLH